MSRAVASFVAVLLLVSHALCLLHLGLQPHVLSLTTGRVLHQHQRRPDPHPLGGSTNPDARDECKIIAALTQAAVVPAVATVAPNSCLLVQDVPTAKSSQVTSGRGRLYLLSPSQSPPRA